MVYLLHSTSPMRRELERGKMGDWRLEGGTMDIEIRSTGSVWLNDIMPTLLFRCRRGSSQ
jgi:hypothetical protein